MSGWKTVALRDLAESIDYGVTASASGQCIGPKFLRISDIQRGAVVWENVPWCECSEDVAEQARLKSGDIVFARTGATTGKSFLIRECPEEAVFASYLIRVRPSDVADPRFVSRFFETPDYWAQIARGARGVAQPGVNASTLSAIQVPLPSMAEQRRIAEILDKADALRASRRSALAQLDTLTQSIFLDMFGDPAANPKRWPLVSFREVGENQDAQRIPVKSSERGQLRGDYPYYGASGVIDWVDDYIFEGDRLLVGEDGANLIARTTPVAFIASGRYWVNNHAHVIAANERADLRFLQFFIEHLDLKPFISGTAQPKLNRTNLDRIPVPLPPLRLQNEFAEQLAAISSLAADHRCSFAGFDSLFFSLQQRAFRGEL